MISSSLLFGLLLEVQVRCQTSRQSGGGGGACRDGVDLSHGLHVPCGDQRAKGRVLLQPRPAIVFFGRRLLSLSALLFGEEALSLLGSQGSAIGHVLLGVGWLLLCAW